MDEFVHEQFHGEMVNKLLEIDKELYSEFMVEEKGEYIMCIELLKALYQTLQAAWLLWEILLKIG